MAEIDQCGGFVEAPAHGMASDSFEDVVPNAYNFVVQGVLYCSKDPVKGAAVGAVV